VRVALQMDLEPRMPPLKFTARAALTDKTASWQEFNYVVLLAE